MTLYGWDASDFDHDRGPMDMAAAASAGISFFTHKYTESTSTKHHPQAAMNGARAAGIPFLAAYVVPRSPGPSVAAQAAYLIAYADQVTPWWRTFPGWFWQVDTEHWSYDKVSPAVGAAMCAELRKRTGKATIHYAPRWAYGEGVPGTDPLWASSYVPGSGDFRTLAGKVTDARWAAYSGRTPAILQYSSSATIGRQPTCDANLFRGSRDDFARLIGGTAPAAAPARKEPGMIRLILADPKASKDYGNGGVYLTNGTTGLGDHNHIGPTLNTALDKAGVPLVSCATVEDMLQAATFARDSGPDIDVDVLATKIATGIAGSGANPLTKADIPAVAAAVRAELSEALEG